jgi:ribosomal protein S18 acetylase RimI-like enzyme/8-oxo-dGTP pyrophosphatase MutT (NUDIX family)
MAEITRPATVSIFLRDLYGRLSAHLRDDKPTILYPNCWSTLGGAVEDGESPAEAARRELLEEIEFCPPLTFWRSFDHTFEVAGQVYRVVIHAFTGETDRTPAQINLREGQRMAFLNREVIDRLPFAFGLDALYRAYYDEFGSAHSAVPMTEYTPAVLGQAPLVHRLMRAAFAEYGHLVPPSGANLESVADVVKAIEQGGAVLAWLAGEPVGSARFRVEPDELYVGRVAVLPEYRGYRIGVGLMQHMEQVAQQHDRQQIRVGVRMQLPENVSFYQRLGYELVAIEDHPSGLEKSARLVKRLTKVTA